MIWYWIGVALLVVIVGAQCCLIVTLIRELCLTRAMFLAEGAECKEWKRFAHQLVEEMEAMPIGKLDPKPLRQMLNLRIRESYAVRQK